MYGQPWPCFKHLKRGRLLPASQTKVKLLRVSLMIFHISLLVAGRFYKIKAKEKLQKQKIKFSSRSRHMNTSLMTNTHYYRFREIVIYNCLITLALCATVEMLDTDLFNRSFEFQLPSEKFYRSSHVKKAQMLQSRER